MARDGIGAEKYRQLLQRVHDDPVVELPLPWQLCSGYADGRPWAYLGMSAQAHFTTTDPEAHLAVEPLDKPELDHAHRFRHRIDVEVVDDRHRWTLRPRWGAYVLARIPLRSARPTLTSRNAAPAAWQAWSTSTAEEFGALA